MAAADGCVLLFSRPAQTQSRLLHAPLSHSLIAVKNESASESAVYVLQASPVFFFFFVGWCCNCLRKEFAHTSSHYWLMALDNCLACLFERDYLQESLSELAFFLGGGGEFEAPWESQNRTFGGRRRQRIQRSLASSRELFQGLYSAALMLVQGVDSFWPFCVCCCEEEVGERLLMQSTTGPPIVHKPDRVGGHAAVHGE